MGRHRSDPRERLRYAVVAALILTIVVLLAVGGFALYGALKPKTTGNGKGARQALAGPAVVASPAGGSVR